MSKLTLFLEVLNTAAALGIVYAATWHDLDTVYWVAAGLCASQGLGLWSYLRDYWGDA
jgi:hypothetical protein